MTKVGGTGQLTIHPAQHAKQALEAFAETRRLDAASLDLGKAYHHSRDLAEFAPTALIQAQAILNQHDPVQAAKLIQKNLHSFNIEPDSPMAKQLVKPLLPVINDQLRDLPSLPQSVLNAEKLFTQSQTSFRGTNPSLTNLLSVGTELVVPQEPGAFFANSKVEKIEPNAREWAINFALTQHFSTQDIPKRAQDALRMRSLAYLTKFANIPGARLHQWQSTPLQMDKDIGFYARGSSGRIEKALTAAAAKTLGMPNQNVFLTTDTRFMDVIRRDYSSHGATTDFTLWNEQNFEAIFDSLHAGNEIFLDITGVFNQCGADHTGLDGAKPVSDVLTVSHALVMGALEAECYKRIPPRDGQHPKTKKQLENLKDGPNKTALQKGVVKLLADLKSKLTTGGMVQIGNLSALVASPFSSAPEFGAHEEYASLDLSTRRHIRQKLATSGFTVGPTQALENLTDLAPTTAATLEALHIPTDAIVDFGTKLTIQRFKSITALLESPTAKAFSDVADRTKGPYQRILTKTTLRLLEGLNKEGVHKEMQILKLSTYAQMSYNRILGFMNQATKQSDNFSVFFNYTQLIHEEIANLLAIAAPHSQAHFSTTLAEVSKFLPTNFDKAIQPHFDLTNSATRAFASVLTGCEEIKFANSGSKALQVAVQTDSYYEPSHYVLKQAKDHTALDFNPSNPKACTELKIQLNDKKLDIYLCEFHHNIAYSRQSYQSEDVTAQVRALFDNDLVAEKFTVALDTTIATTNAEEIKEFLKEFEPEIATGKLNVVVYRSAQKFDQMGMDNYNGGIAATINLESAFSSFNTHFQNKEDHLSRSNVQGITHLNKYAQQELNDYRTSVMKNTQRLGNPSEKSIASFPEHMLCLPENTDRSVLQIAVNEDRQATFIDLRFPHIAADSHTAKLLYGKLMSCIKHRIQTDPVSFPASTRASFGFPHSNFTLIDNAKMRFTPGLEGEEILANYRDFFVSANNLIAEVNTDFASLDVSKEKAYAGAAGCLDSSLLALHAKILKAGEHAPRTDLMKLAEAFITPPTINPQGALRLIERIQTLRPIDRATRTKLKRTRAEAQRLKKFITATR